MRRRPFRRQATNRAVRALREDLAAKAAERTPALQTPPLVYVSDALLEASAVRLTVTRRDR